MQQSSASVSAERSGGCLCAADGHWYGSLICCAIVFAKINIMVPVLLIGIPLLAGLIGFSLKDVSAKNWALIASILTLVVSLVGLSLPGDSKQLLFNTAWMGSLNSHFAIGLDG